MEKLLSNKWDSLLLNELKEEALINARFDDDSLRNKAVYLYDHPKMSVFKSEYMVLETTFPEVVLMSKNLFARVLAAKEYEDRDALVAKAKFIVKDVGHHPVLTTPVEDFVEWAEKEGLSDVVNALNLKKKPRLKM